MLHNSLGQTIYPLESLLPEELHRKYLGWNLVSTTAYTQIYEARTHHKELCTVKLITADCVQKSLDYYECLTTFLQEILYLCCRTGDRNLIVIEDFLIWNDGCAVVMKKCREMNQEPNLQLESTVQIEKLLMDVTKDLDFLCNRMKFNGFKISKNFIYKTADQDLFFIDWSKVYESKMKLNKFGESSILSISSNPDIQIAEEIYSLGESILESINPQYNSSLLLDLKQDHEQKFQALVESSICFSKSVPSQLIVKEMFAKEENEKATAQEVFKRVTAHFKGYKLEDTYFLKEENYFLREELKKFKEAAESYELEKLYKTTSLEKKEKRIKDLQSEVDSLKSISIMLICYNELYRLLLDLMTSTEEQNKDPEEEEKKEQDETVGNEKQKLKGSVVQQLLKASIAEPDNPQMTTAKKLLKASVAEPDNPQMTAVQNLLKASIAEPDNPQMTAAQKLLKASIAEPDNPQITAEKIETDEILKAFTELKTILEKLSLPRPDFNSEPEKSEDVALSNLNLKNP